MKTKRTWLLGLPLLWVVSSVWAESPPVLDPSKLPPASTKKVDFTHDIKPILENACWRCHGRESAKSHFRLTDRAAALKGGDEGVDIVPGQSAKSPLVYYTARLVKNMEMPPEGKGTPLTPEQVGLLRAWIDQGVAWDSGAGSGQTAPTGGLDSALGWTGVEGDRAKFRQLEGRPEGWDGGAQHFEIRQQGADGSVVTAEGHALRDDYRMTLDLRKPDLGFTRFGFEQFRKYDEDSGGYYAPFSPSMFRLDEDLHLDVGRAYVEAGLTLPKWPQIVVGYEYLYKDGSKSMLTWGPVASPSGNYLDARSIYPSAKQIDEHTHAVHLNVSYELSGFLLEDRLRFESYSLSTSRTDAMNVPAGQPTPDLAALIQEGHKYTQVANGVQVQKEVTRWWLLSTGYRYSWLDGDSDFRLTPQDGSGQLTAGSAWSASQIVLHEVSQLVNANSQFRPLPQLSASLGLQGRWQRQESFGDINLDEVVDPTDPTGGVFRFPATARSTLDQTTAEESCLLRYTGLPATALFGEASFRQEDYNRAASQDGGPHAFLLDSDATARWQDYRLGFSTAPWQAFTLGGHYRRRERQTDYDYALAQSDTAYPGFIRSRNIAADEFEARVGWRPSPWLQTTLTYQWTGTDYRTTTGATSPDIAGLSATPGGEILAGRYTAHTVSANATYTPGPRLTFGGTISYQNSQTTTANNDSPSVAPYGGDLWSALVRATYQFNPKTSLSANYVFSLARYAQHNEASGLPLGVDFARHGLQIGLARRLSDVITARVQYGYFSYAESSSAHLRDYNAHQVLMVLNFHWPDPPKL